VKHRSFRIAVIGTSGSGKTTVSTEIARRLKITHIELDAIHWRQGWKGISLTEFRDRVEEATTGDAWVVDGNYRGVRDIVWRKAELVVWLDLPFNIVFWRIVLRTVKRIVTRQKLWNKNRERVDALVGPDSMPLWVMKTYWRRKTEYPALFSKPEYAHLRVIRLTSIREVTAWLEALEDKPEASELHVRPHG
jgi:adenylate kinase family enzyme